ncbi:hypothetical protein [Ancylomarina euxinus]|nr:hypothetical protein [Ancylomarina euxinus]MCZ4693672.1 hypothetical protein [Ancylomarina euxinus]
MKNIELIYVFEIKLSVSGLLLLFQRNKETKKEGKLILFTENYE